MKMNDIMIVSLAFLFSVLLPVSLFFIFYYISGSESIAAVETTTILGLLYLMLN